MTHVRTHMRVPGDVPAFVVLLYSNGAIHRAAAEAKPRAIEHNTSPTLLVQARNAIAALHP